MTMENLVRGVLDGALDWVCRPFGLTVSSVPGIARIPAGQSPEEVPVQRYRDGFPCRLPSSPDARMHSASAKSIARAPTKSKIEVRAVPEEAFDDMGELSKRGTTSEVHEPKNEFGSEAGLIQYTDGPDRAITVNDGAKECISFLLTEETVLRLVEIAQKRKDFRELSRTYQEVSRDADIGQGFLDYFPIMLEDATTQEEYDQLNRDLEQRKPDILKDIERKEYLKSEMQSQNEALDYTRDLAEGAFEQVLLDAQLLPEGREEYAKNLGEESSDMGASAIPNTPKEEQNFVNENRSEDLDPREELDLARQMVFELQDKFDHEREFQEQKVTEYRQLQQQGLVNFPISELDLFHVKQRAETTRALIEAEEALEQARARARGLGMLENEPDQESGFVDGIDDGSSVCDDFAADVSDLNPTTVQAWVSRVAEAQDEHLVEPDVDEWDSRSVSMSDSISVVADGKWRKRIDRWHYIEDSTRDGAFDGDAGAMGLAVLTGELQLG